MSSGRSFQTVGASKSKAVVKVFLEFMYRWTELRNLREPFIWQLYVVSSTKSRQKRIKVTGMTPLTNLQTRVAVLKIQRNSTWSQWSRLRIGDAHVYLL